MSSSTTRKYYEYLLLFEISVAYNNRKYYEYLLLFDISVACNNRKYYDYLLLFEISVAYVYFLLIVCRMTFNQVYLNSYGCCL